MKQVERSDPGNQYGVIYQWGTIGIGINAEKIKALMPDAPLDSFKLIFDPEVAKKLAPCGITILDWRPTPSRPCFTISASTPIRIRRRT